MEMTINTENEVNSCETKQSGDPVEMESPIKRPLEDLDEDISKKLKSTPELSCVSK